MAIGFGDRLTFLYQNINGKFYEVAISTDTGIGYAVLVNSNVASNPTGSTQVAATRTALTVDAAHLAKLKGGNPYHDSFWIGQSVFNTSQRLAQLLTA